MKYSFLKLKLLCFSLISLNTFGNISNSPPNFIFLIAEDISPDLPVYGDSTIQTPALGKLAQHGVTYLNAYTISPVCAPSRSSIITGMYPTSIGTHHMRTQSAREDIPNYDAVPPVHVKHFTEYLRAAGYYCFHWGKHDIQYPSPVSSWDMDAEQKDFFDIPNDKPFFAMGNFNITHESNIWNRAELPLEVDPASINTPPYYPDDPVIRNDMARYYSNIVELDKRVGVFLHKAEQEGFLENTYVFFVGDHGRALPRGKRNLYEQGIRVPFIIKHPGNKNKGTYEDRLISFIDIAPTILSLAEVDIPSHLQGKAFLGSKAAKPRTYIYAAKDRMGLVYDQVRVVRGQRFKYFRNFDPHIPILQKSNYRDQMAMMERLYTMHESNELNSYQVRLFQTPKPAEELYDLKYDPYELNNLASKPEYQDTLKKLRAENLDWMHRTHDMGFMNEIYMIHLMWPDLQQPQTKVPEFTKNGEELEITCGTTGASIVYRISNNGQWKLYVQPLIINENQTIEATAVRYGYKQSPIVKYIY
jgi:arylsulfatase A-like enzyme